MTDRALDEAFDAQNRTDGQSAEVQTLGKLAVAYDAGSGLLEPSRSLPRTVMVVILTAAVVLEGMNISASESIAGIHFNNNPSPYLHERGILLL